MTILEQILDKYLQNNNKFCIDLAHYQIKREYCKARDFELRRGRVYLFAVKQQSLNLFD